MDGESVPPRSRWLAWFGVAAMVVAVVELLLFGVIGVGRNPDGFHDSIFFYAAGRALLAGQTPYDPPTLRAHAEGRLDREVARFYYPPQIAPWFMLLGLFSYQGARMVLMLMNIAATAGGCVLALRAIRPPQTASGPPEALSAIPWLMPAIIVGDPWLVNMLWGGGVVPIVVLCLMEGWNRAERGRPISAGILMGLATIKPQFALLPLVWLVCERRWKVLAAAAATALVCMAYPLAILGPKGAIGGWLGLVARYAEEYCNALGWSHLMGISNLLFAFGVRLPDLKIPTVLLTVGLWFVRKRFRREDVLAILTSLSMVLLVAHDYDLVVLVPLLVAHWRHLADHPRRAAVALLLALLLISPDQLFPGIPDSWRAQRHTLAMLILLGWLLWLSSRRPAEAASPEKVQTAPAPGS